LGGRERERERACPEPCGGEGVGGSISDIRASMIQIPMIPGGLPPLVFERALESLLNLLDRARS